MPNPENIIGKGRRFSNINQPKNPGRKPSLYNHIKKLLGTEAKAELSKEDYFKLIQFLLEQPLDNLKKLADSKNTPIWIVGVVRAVVKDANAGRTTTLDSLFDRLFGKASQPLTGKDGHPIEINTSVDYSGLSDADLLAAHALIRKAIHGKSDK